MGNTENGRRGIQNRIFYYPRTKEKPVYPTGEFDSRTDPSALRALPSQGPRLIRTCVSWRSSKQGLQTRQPEGAGKTQGALGNLESLGEVWGAPARLGRWTTRKNVGPVPPDLVTFQRHFKNPHCFIVFPNLHISVPFHLSILCRPNKSYLRLRQEETEALTVGQRCPSSQALLGRCFVASAWQVKKRSP